MNHLTKLAAAVGTADGAWRQKITRYTGQLARAVGVTKAALDAQTQAMGRATPALPVGTNWHATPDLWAQRCDMAALHPIENGTRAGPTISVYHDGTAPEVTLSQSRNPIDAAANPFALSLEAFAFDGSYLSLAIPFDKGAIDGLNKESLIGVVLDMAAEADPAAYARLNVRHGPNIEKLTREIDMSLLGQPIEFDVFYTDLEPDDVTEIWLDLIFKTVAMNRIDMRSITLFRRARASV